MTKYIEELERKKKEIEEALERESNVEIVKGTELHFYEFNQNNSGGDFHCDDKVCHRLVIQAHSYQEARRKALELGVYFDGCSLGLDCGCCGDRWSDWEKDPIDDKDDWNENSVGVYSHYDDAEGRWHKKYGIYEIVEKPEWNEEYSREFRGKIKFKGIEEYCQYLANEYGWTKPDVRIFYHNGNVKEIFTEKIS